MWSLASTLLFIMITFAFPRSRASLLQNQYNVLRHSYGKSYTSGISSAATKRLILEQSRKDDENDPSHSDDNLPLHMSHVLTEESDLNWDNRIQLQSRFSLAEKGWCVNVEWRQTPYGVGLFALQEISASTILRKGIFGRNLFQFRSTTDIEEFCRKGKNEDEYDAQLRYVSDYLWGFRSYGMDERGYLMHQGENNHQDDQPHDVMAMWVPGNGLNHSPNPSMVYRTSEGGIDLVALTDIVKDEEILDDYRRHGIAPEWLKTFGAERSLTLNFVGCNDFVIPDASSS